MEKFEPQERMLQFALVIDGFYLVTGAKNLQQQTGKDLFFGK